MSADQNPARGERAPDSPPSGELQEEIDRLRSLMRQLYARVATQGGELETADLAKTLDALGLTSTRLANLLKTQQALRAPGAIFGAAAAFDRALAEVMKELGIR
jgi:hypothetical protein